jgi:hypothetical protein
MRCAVDAKDKNKEVGTALNSFHMHRGNSVLLSYFCCLSDLIQAYGQLVVRGPHFLNSALIYAAIEVQSF